VAAIESPCARDSAACRSSKQQDGTARSALCRPGKNSAGTAVALEIPRVRDTASQFQQLSGCEHQFKLQVHSGGAQRISRSEPLARCASRSGGVPPLLCHQPRRVGGCGAPSEIANYARAAPVRHNTSVKRSANGRPPSPVWRYAVHFRQPGLGVLPSSPAYLER
jgi:hypothetical protein